MKRFACTLAFALAAAAFATSCDDHVSTIGGVGLYNTAERTFVSISTNHPVTRAEWLVDGESFFAFDTIERRVRVYNIDGTVEVTLPQKIDGNEVSWFTPVPDGSGFLVEFRDNHDSMMWLDLPALEARPFGTGQSIYRQGQFSPDGAYLAYLESNGDTDRVMLARPDGSNPHEVVSNSNAGESMGVGSGSWSPDSKWLKIHTWDCPGDGKTTCPVESDARTEVFDLTGTSVWSREHASIGDIVQWAGPSRLLLDDRINGFAEPSMVFVALPVGDKAPANVGISTYFSPNGQFRIAGSLYDCDLVDDTTGEIVVEDGGCGIEDWSRDSSLALVWDTLCGLPGLSRTKCVSGRAIDATEPSD